MKYQPVAIVLSGCGVNDGVEITEAVGVLLALSESGIPYEFFAPDREQMQVIDHFTGKVMGESRNIMHEAARIARGRISPLAELDMLRYSALVFPGGFGAAKNLTTFATDGVNAHLYHDVKAAVLACIAAGKPLVALCASPLVQGLAAQAAGLRNVRITFGSYAEGGDLAEAVVAWGQQHVETRVDEACVDTAHRFVSAPAYMYGNATPAEVFASCRAAVSALQTLLEQNQQ